VTLYRFGDAARRGHLLLVIQIDVVIRDVIEFGLRELELRRVDVLADGSPQLLALRVVERREYDRRAELAFVDQVVRLLVVALRPRNRSNAAMQDRLCCVHRMS
jgi:hypothetical protein